MTERDVDSQTEAIIEASPDPLYREGVVRVDGITSFSYSSNVLAVGDPFSVVVADPRGAHVKHFKRGWSARLYLRNPKVNGGAQTLKADGLVTTRVASSDNAGGTLINLTCADVGWHLANNDAPLWFNLRNTTLERLAVACVFPQDVFKGDTDPGWGFADGVRTSNAQSRSIKRGLVFSGSERAGFVAAAIAGSVVFVQVQPGQRMADLLITYARRVGLLVGVSVDRHLTFFLPNYVEDVDPLRVELSRSRPLGASGNVLSAQLTEDISTVYTHVMVVGENPIYQIVGDGGVRQFVPQFTKLYGRHVDASNLPFRRRVTMSDGEIVVKPERRAKWHMARGLFDAQTLEYKVRGHHQGGQWWESDLMVTVQDEVLGVSGGMYVVATRCVRDAGGDVTYLTLKPPDLLTEIPLDPR